MAEADGLSINRCNRDAVTRCANFTRTPYESAYGDSPTGNLEDRIGIRTPLQQGFHGYRKAGLSVGVSDETTLLASEQGIVGTVVSFAHCTAAATPLGRVPAIDRVQRDAFVKTSTHQIRLEEAEGHPHDLPIESLPLRAEPSEVLDSYFCVVFESEVCNLSHDLPDPVLHEIVLLRSGNYELSPCGSASPVGVGAQDALSLEYLPPSLPDVLSEIGLPQDLAFGGYDADSEAFAVNIDAEDILSWRWFVSLLGQICHKLEVRGQPEGLACPSIANQVPESLKVPVATNGNRGSLMWKESEFHKEEGFGLECLAVSGYIEFDRNAINMDAGSVFPPNTSGEVADHLNVEPGVLLACKPGSPPKVPEIGVCLALAKHTIRFHCRGSFKFGKNSLLGSSNFSLQQNCPLHPNTQKRNFIFHISATTQVLPPVDNGRLLGGS